MREWKVKLRFETGLTHLSSFTLTDVGTFIKQEKIKNNDKKACKTIPLEKWLTTMVLNRAMSTYPITKLVTATLIKKE